MRESKTPRVSNYRRAAIALAAVTSVALVTAAAPAVASTWSSPPVNVSASSADGGDPSLAVDSAGIVTAVWRQTVGGDIVVQAARKTALGWGQPETLSDAGQNVFNDPAIAAGPAGTAVAAWSRDTPTGPVIQAARYDGQAWGAPVTLSYTTATNPKVVVDSTGIATVVWQRATNPPRIEFSQFRSGQWTPAGHGFYWPAATGAGMPDLAVDGAGTVTAVWTELNTVKVARIPPTGLNDAETTTLPSIGTTFAMVDPPRIAAGAAGDVTVVWEALPTRRRGPDLGDVYAARFTGGTWDTANWVQTRLSTEDGAAGQSAEPMVAVDAAGVATATWRCSCTSAQTVQAARFEGQAWGTPRTVGQLTAGAGPFSVQLTTPWVASGPAGSSIITFRVRQNSNSGPLPVMAAAWDSGTGTWGTPAELFMPPGTGSPTNRRVVVAPSGAATVIWDLWTGSSDTMQSVGYTTSPGAPTGVGASLDGVSAMVRWTAPVADGGTPITRYTVTATPGGAQCTATGATTCTVTGLSYGTAYTFSVRAVNAEGTSAASAPSAALTPEAPIAPQNPSTGSPGGSSAAVAPNPASASATPAPKASFAVLSQAQQSSGLPVASNGDLPLMLACPADGPSCAMSGALTTTSGALERGYSPFARTVTTLGSFTGVKVAAGRRRAVVVHLSPARIAALSAAGVRVLPARLRVRSTSAGVTTTAVQALRLHIPAASRLAVTG